MVYTGRLREHMSITSQLTIWTSSGVHSIQPLVAVSSFFLSQRKWVEWAVLQWGLWHMWVHNSKRMGSRAAQTTSDWSGFKSYLSASWGVWQYTQPTWTRWYFNTIFKKNIFCWISFDLKSQNANNSGPVLNVLTSHHLVMNVTLVLLSGQERMPLH